MSPHSSLVQIGTGGQPANNQQEPHDPPEEGAHATVCDFAAWLDGTEASLRSGNGCADVPCGNCTACCRSSMFIHIKPNETQTIRRIPKALLFAAPGLPRGHVLLGYNAHGHCPILVDGKCSIYEDRPQTCRDYDCRIYAATGISVDPQTQAEIAQRVSEWTFSYKTEESYQKHMIVREASAFLQHKKYLFQPGSLPNNPVQLAVLAVMIYRLFAARTLGGAADIPDASIAHEIMSALAAAGGPSPTIPK